MPRCKQYLICFCVQGCTEVTLLNRSRPRAEALAASFPEVHFDIRLMPDLMKVTPSPPTLSQFTTPLPAW